MCERAPGATRSKAHWGVFTCPAGQSLDSVEAGDCAGSWADDEESGVGAWASSDAGAGAGAAAGAVAATVGEGDASAGLVVLDGGWAVLPGFSANLGSSGPTNSMPTTDPSGSSCTQTTRPRNGPPSAMSASSSRISNSWPSSTRSSITTRIPPRLMFRAHPLYSLPSETREIRDEISRRAPPPPRRVAGIPWAGIPRLGVRLRRFNAITVYLVSGSKASIRGPGTGSLHCP